jgi:acyl carrier protein
MDEVTDAFGTTPSDGEVLEVVRRCVSASLAVPPDRIRPDSRIVDDLGADSLDFVDIVFLLQEQTGVDARSTELGFLTRLDFSSPEVMRDGALQPELVARLARWVPGLADAPRVTPQVLFSHLTVEAVCRMVVAARSP